MKPDASTLQTSTSPSFSLPSPLRSSPAWGVEDLDTDDLLEVLTNAKQQATYWSARIQACLDRLDTLVEDEELAEDLTYNDFHIYRQPGRKSYDYPDYIKEAQASLKQSQELSIALGDATTKVGKPFWTLKPL